MLWVQVTLYVSLDTRRNIGQTGGIKDSPMPLSKRRFLQSLAGLATMALSLPGKVTAAAPSVVSGPIGGGTTQMPFAGCTIEDPAEYCLSTDQCPVIDVLTSAERQEKFRQALSAAMRNNPDVVFIGEVRDPRTLQAAERLRLPKPARLSFAQSGTPLRNLFRRTAHWMTKSTPGQPIALETDIHPQEPMPTLRFEQDPPRIT